MTDIDHAYEDLSYCMILMYFVKFTVCVALCYRVYIFISCIHHSFNPCLASHFIIIRWSHVIYESINVSLFYARVTCFWQLIYSSNAFFWIKWLPGKHCHALPRHYNHGYMIVWYYMVEIKYTWMSSQLNLSFQQPNMIDFIWLRSL